MKKSKGSSKILNVFDQFEKAALPFRGFFDYEFGEDSMQEIRKALELGAKVDDQFLKALDMLKYEATKLRKAGKKLRKQL